MRNFYKSTRKKDKESVVNWATYRKSNISKKKTKERKIMVNKYMKICSTFLLNNNMQIKTTEIIPFTLD